MVKAKLVLIHFIDFIKEKIFFKRTILFGLTRMTRNHSSLNNIKQSYESYVVHWFWHQSQS